MNLEKYNTRIRDRLTVEDVWFEMKIVFCDITSKKSEIVFAVV